MIRTEAQLTVSRFCELVGLSRRTYYARRAQHLAGRTGKGPWPTPVLDDIEPDVVQIAHERPGWGHRKVSAALSERGHENVSASSVQRVMARRGLRRTRAARPDGAATAEPAGETSSR